MKTCYIDNFAKKKDCPNTTICCANVLNDISIGKFNLLANPPALSCIKTNPCCLPAPIIKFLFCAYISITIKPLSSLTFNNLLSISLIKNCCKCRLEIDNKIISSNVSVTADTTINFPVVLDFFDTMDCCCTDNTDCCCYSIYAKSLIEPSIDSSLEILISPLSLTAISSSNLIIGKANNSLIPSLIPNYPIVYSANLFADINHSIIPCKIILTYLGSFTCNLSQSVCIKLYKSYDCINMTCIYSTPLLIQANIPNSFSFNFCDIETSSCNNCIYYYISIYYLDSNITYDNIITISNSSFTALIIEK